MGAGAKVEKGHRVLCSVIRIVHAQDVAVESLLPKRQSKRVQNKQRHLENLMLLCTKL